MDSRQAFLDYLVRSARDRSLTEDDAALLLRRFDAGEHLTVPEGSTVDYEKAITAALLLFALFYRRYNSVNLLQDEFHGQTWILASLPLLAWQSGMAQLIAANVIAARMLATGSTAIAVTPLKPAITRQLAFLGRFADKRALLDHQGNPMSPDAIAVRSELYAGAGRAAYFEAIGSEAGDGEVLDFISLDDGSTCGPCLDADFNGPYLSSGSYPIPGDICSGGGRCRCRLEVRYAPSEAMRLAA